MKRHKIMSKLYHNATNLTPKHHRQHQATNPPLPQKRTLSKEPYMNSPEKQNIRKKSIFEKLPNKKGTITVEPPQASSNYNSAPNSHHCRKDRVKLFFQREDQTPIRHLNDLTTSRFSQSSQTEERRSSSPFLHPKKFKSIHRIGRSPSPVQTLQSSKIDSSSRCNISTDSCNQSMKTLSTIGKIEHRPYLPTQPSEVTAQTYYQAIHQEKRMEQQRLNRQIDELTEKASQAVRAFSKDSSKSSIAPQRSIPNTRRIKDSLVKGQRGQLAEFKARKSSIIDNQSSYYRVKTTYDSGKVEKEARSRLNPECTFRQMIIGRVGY